MKHTLKTLIFSILGYRHRVFILSVIIINFVVLSLVPYWVDGSLPKYEKNTLLASAIWYPIELFCVYGLLFVAYQKEVGADNTLELSIYSLILIKFFTIPAILGGTIYTPPKLVSVLLDYLPLNDIKNLFPNLTLTEWLLLGIFLVLVFICIRLFLLDKLDYRD